MRSRRVLWIVCSALVLIQGAKSSEESAPRDAKETDEVDEGRSDTETTLSPSELAVDLPENWEQTKEDRESLFLNKSDKNDLEPYPMALSEDTAGEVYDGQQGVASDDKSNAKARTGTLEQVLMRAEYYGEPPSMGRQPSRKKRNSFRSTLDTGNNRMNKRGTKYSAIRMKRDTGMRSEDLLALLSLWDAQRRSKGMNGNYYNPDTYYNQLDPYEDGADTVDMDDKWYNEQVVPSSNYYGYGDKPTHFKYSRNYDDFIPDHPGYLQQLEGYRRKRQWAGFGNRNRLAKRFMVAKKRSEPNQYYYSQKSYKPREDLYTLNELLKGSQGMRDRGIPVSRRAIL